MTEQDIHQDPTLGTKQPAIEPLVEAAITMQMRQFNGLEADRLTQIRTALFTAARERMESFRSLPEGAHANNLAVAVVVRERVVARAREILAEMRAKKKD